MAVRLVKKVLIFVLFLCVLAALGGGGYFLYNTRDTAPEGSVCDPEHARYEKTFCNNVGRSAYIIASDKKIELGTIFGVTWRARGDIIGGTGKLQKRSDRNRYYYMISKDAGKHFAIERVENILLK
ncbi:MAG: hypothetical protein K0R63_1540 [Rickettsiales bacterium]|jgi:hypothetical protein|nr:hypothetical protein [Rickettsiales bacterium]